MIFKFYLSIQNNLSLVLKKNPLIFRFFVLFLDNSTKIISIFLTNNKIYFILCVLLFFCPIFYYDQLYNYYIHLYDVGFSFVNIISCLHLYFSFSFLLSLYVFIFLFLLVIITTPLLFIDCLTQELQKMYGSDILKLRGCNSKLTPVTKFAGLMACLICGQETAGNIIGHKISTDAWMEVKNKNPEIELPQPKYQGTIQKVGEILDVIRKQK